MIKISGEYALSLFNLAKEQGRIEDYSKSLETVREVVSEHRDWLSLLHSPAIPTHERLALIEEAWGGLEVKEVVKFLKLLCEKGHAHLLEECIADFFLLENEAKKHVP
ncbi:MAG: F0F1 ATP synthase subunit delta, partial [Clostridia bacterium]|nr:F0F1 ATP synthase subunit delta [Clostridia bacterium]